jgi:nitrite reductase (NADH) small subunit
MVAALSQDAALTWLEVGLIGDVPLRGSRVVKTASGDVAVFRAVDGTVFALDDRCPHKGGPLSQGIVHGHTVTCPLHNWVIGLDTGEAHGADQGCTRTIPVRLEGERIYLGLAGARLR